MPAPESPPIRASTPRAIFRPRRFAAPAVSIALHLVILHVLGGVSWTTTETEPDRRINVVWLKDWPPPEQDHTAVQPEERTPVPPEAEAEPEELDRQARLPERSARPPEPQSVRQDPPAEPTADEPSSAIPAPQRTRPGVDPLPVEEAPGPITEAAEDERALRAFDWDEARRHVIERMREEREREESYRTFSPEDWIAEHPPTEPGPATPSFKPWPPCPVVNRRAVQFAMVMAGVCFRTRAPSVLFSHLKADYMKGRPVCEPVTDANGNETYKCRLVIEPER